VGDDRDQGSHRRRRRSPRRGAGYQALTSELTAEAVVEIEPTMLPAVGAASLA
jgi:hypothetical protein